MLVQEFYDSTTGGMHTITIDLTALRLTIDEEPFDYADAADLRAGYIARVGTMIEANENLNDIDNGPARLWNLDSVAAYEGASEPDVHPAVIAAIDALLVDGCDEHLADSLSYAIALDEGGEPAARGSKRGGDPDVPPGFEWPGERLFVAQLALRELAPIDLERALPPDGMLSLFVSETCSDNRVFYFPDVDSLERHTLPTRLEDLAALYRHDLEEKRLVPRPIVTAFPGAKSEFSLPEAARIALCEGLGHDVELEWPSDKVFGEPDGEGGFDVIATAIKRPADVRDPAGFVSYVGPLTLALQLRFADGYLYLAVPPADLPVGDLRNARLAYWGT